MSSGTLGISVLLLCIIAKDSNAGHPVELVDKHRANCPPQGKDDARRRRGGLSSSSFPSSWLMIATLFELVASNSQGVCII